MADGGAHSNLLDNCPDEARAKAAGGAMLCALIALSIAGALWYLTSPMRWPATQGVVLEGHYFPYDNGKLWGPIIIYEYEAAGRRFRSDNITLWRNPSKYECDTTLWAWDARRLVESHPVGSTIEVRHHPTSPEKAVVAWTINHPQGFAAIIALAVSVGLCAWLVWRTKGAPRGDLQLHREHIERTHYRDAG